MSKIRLKLLAFKIPSICKLSVAEEQSKSSPHYPRVNRAFFLPFYGLQLQIRLKSAHFTPYTPVHSYLSIAESLQVILILASEYPGTTPLLVATTLASYSTTSTRVYTLHPHTPVNSCSEKSKASLLISHHSLSVWIQLKSHMKF